MASNTSNSNSATDVYLAAVEGGGSSFRVAICQVVDTSNGTIGTTSTATTTNSNNDVDTTTPRDTNNNNNNTILSLVIPINDTISIIVKEYKQIDSKVDPINCIDECCQFFKTFIDTYKKYSSLGIATFGPVGLNYTNSNSNNTTTETYGCILSTSPKGIWRNVNIVQPIATACELQDDYNNYSNNRYDNNTSSIWIETDVNAPAYSEYVLHNSNITAAVGTGSGTGNGNTNGRISSCAYITVGTGVGVGLVINDQPVHGMMHPEGGHVPIRQLNNDPYTGYSWGCQIGSTIPYFGQGTVEGIVSSIALSERYIQRTQISNSNENDNENTNTNTIDQREILSIVPDDDEIWDHAVNAIANLCTTIILLTSIEKIVLGGGIIINRSSTIMPKIRAKVLELINGYVDLPLVPYMMDTQLATDTDDTTDTNNNNNSSNGKLLLSPDYITTSIYGDNAGLVGSILLSYRAYIRSSTTSTSIVPTTTTTTRSTANDNDNNDAEASNNKIKAMKQIAFSHGLWHGILIGIIGTGLLVKYVFTSSSSSSTSTTNRRR